MCLALLAHAGRAQAASRGSSFLASFDGKFAHIGQFYDVCASQNVNSDTVAGVFTVLAFASLLNHGQRVIGIKPICSVGSSLAYCTIS